jgi:hypothetical protein
MTARVGGFGKRWAGFRRIICMRAMRSSRNSMRRAGWCGRIRGARRDCCATMFRVRGHRQGSIGHTCSMGWATRFRCWMRTGSRERVFAGLRRRGRRRRRGFWMCDGRLLPRRLFRERTADLIPLQFARSKQERGLMSNYPHSASKPTGRFELPTRCLRNSCSATEPRRRK